MDEDDDKDEDEDEEEDEDEDEDDDEDDKESKQFDEWKEEWKEEMENWRHELEEWREECADAIKDREPMPPMPPMPPIGSVRGVLMGPMRGMMMGHMRHKPSSRSNVVMSRIRNGELRSIDMLIEAGLFNTRSEAVAYLVGEGIKARKDTFDKASSTLQDIRRIRGEADEYLAKLKKDVGLVKVERSQNHDKKCPACGRDLDKLPADIKVCPYCGSKLDK